MAKVSFAGFSGPTRRALGWLARSVLAGGGVVGVLAGQVWWTRTRPLPTCIDQVASGTEGSAGPVVVLGVAGDSCSTGPGLDDPADIWCRVAARAVAAELGCRIDVRSVAVGGSRVGDVVEHQLAALRAVEPDVVAVVVGGNDAIRGTHHPRLIRQIDQMMAGLEALGCPALVGGLGWLGALPRVPAPLSWLLGLRSRWVDGALRRAVTGRPNVHFVDTASVDEQFTAGGLDWFAPDHFHAAAPGHRAWAELAHAPLRAAVAEVLTMVPHADGRGTSTPSDHNLSTGPLGTKPTG